MARGATTTSHVTDRTTSRESLTEELLDRLQGCTDSAERDRLTCEVMTLHLGLCDALANRYANRGVDRDDLVQVARIALLYAVRRYTPGQGRAFISFALPTITGELKRHFRDRCWMVRPPRKLQEARARVAATSGQLAQRLGRSATPAELAVELGMDAALVREASISDGSYRPWSLDSPVDRDSGTTFADTLHQNDSTDAILDRLSLQRALSTLTRREQQVLKWRFVEGCTQSEIGARLGVSQMQVSRILRRSLERARGAMSEDQPLAS